MSLLAKLANTYRKKFPELKFSVKRPKLDTSFELTGFSRKDGKFIIEICATHKDDIACFLLSHALAHAISWHSSQPPEDPHGQPFWDAYKVTYKIYEDFCDKTNSA